MMLKIAGPLSQDVFIETWYTTFTAPKCSIPNFPTGSMYGIFTYIYHKHQPNVGMDIPVPWILWVCYSRFNEIPKNISSVSTLASSQILTNKIPSLPQRETIVFQSSVFRYYVSFREGSPTQLTLLVGRIFFCWPWC